MEKVHGKLIDEVSKLSKKEVENIFDFLGCALDFYLEHRAGTQPGYMPDFLNVYYTGDASFRNIMIGHTNKNPTEKAYLIDNYPLLVVQSKSTEPRVAYSIACAVSQLGGSLKRKWFKELPDSEIVITNEFLEEMQKEHDEHVARLIKYYKQTEEEEEYSRTFMERLIQDMQDPKIRRNIYSRYAIRTMWNESNAPGWNDAKDKFLGKLALLETE